MGPVRFGRLRAAKRPYGFCAKVTLAVVLGLCFIVVWSIFSSPSSSLTSQRSSFSDISVPVSSSSHSHYKNNNLNPTLSSNRPHQAGAGDGHKVPGDKNKKGDDAYAGKRATGKEIGEGRAHSVASEKGHDKDSEKHVAAVEKNKEGNHHQQQQQQQQEGSTAQSGTTATEPTDNNKEEEVQNEVDNKDEDVPDEDVEIDGDVVQGDDDTNVSMDQEPSEKMEDETVNSKKRTGKKKKNAGPLFDSRAHYSWKLCSVRSKHYYIPCIDIEGTTGKLQRYRHRERSCPAVPPLCLTSLPERYGFPVHWPESKSKVL